MDLAQQECVPCQGGVPPLSPQEAQQLAQEIPQWTLKDKSMLDSQVWRFRAGSAPEVRAGARHLAARLRAAIEREFKFQDFRAAIGFVNKVAEVAEAEDHHPDIHISWNRVTLSLTTHTIKGLSENDFIPAAKIDRL